MNIRASQDEISEIRGGGMKTFEATIPFDNDSSPEDLTPVSLEEAKKEILLAPHHIRGYMSSIHSWEDVNLREDQYVLRYSCGKYYAIVKIKEGGYLFSLYENKTLRQLDACYITTLVNAKDFSNLRLGSRYKKIKKADPDAFVEENIGIMDENGRITEYGFETTHRLDNLATISLTFNGKQKLHSYFVEPADTSVLTYLFGEDLALIS